MGRVDRCRSVSLSQTKRKDINLNDRPQMQNDTKNEIDRSLSPFIVISFDYLHQSHAVTRNAAAFLLWMAAQFPDP